MFPSGHIFGGSREASRDETRGSNTDGDLDATAGSDKWCIVELSLLDARGIRGVYCSVGECGSTGQWLGRSLFTEMLS